MPDSRAVGERSCTQAVTAAASPTPSREISSRSRATRPSQRKESTSGKPGGRRASSLLTMPQIRSSLFAHASSRQESVSDAGTLPDVSKASRAVAAQETDLCTFSTPSASSTRFAPAESHCTSHHGASCTDLISRATSPLPAAAAAEPAAGAARKESWRAPQPETRREASACPPHRALATWPSMSRVGDVPPMVRVELVREAGPATTLARVSSARSPTTLSEGEVEKVSGTDWPCASEVTGRVRSPDFSSAKSASLMVHGVTVAMSCCERCSTGGALGRAVGA
mmetsp:Transcript_5496/g.16389  ORF Transcript_5496/g.16389 Transcript_5496/m.16389 type:complete len:283 (+) Transcript_5496:1246-2094(+)